MATEQISAAKVVMFVKHGLINETIDELESNLSVEFESVTRPLYGLVYMSAPRADIIKMAQLAATNVMRTYYYAEPWKGSRLYVQSHDEGLSIFMLTEVGDRHADRFVQLTSET